MKKVTKTQWLFGIGATLLLLGVWYVFSGLYREEEKALRRNLRETVKEKFPEQTARFNQTVGLLRFNSERTIPEGDTLSRKSVVLVHGLDDPGRVWSNLAPALAEENFNVWLLHYPNDQPVVESARFFFDQLKGIRQTGVQRISIVGHSMGGLVSREMLTSPEIDYNGAAKNEQVPEVASLTMVATPNHGSYLARFRAFAEVRDQLFQLAKGEANWLGAILDGAGEAKIDLLPGSRFLTELNARPHPEGVDQLIIAGITSPWNESDVQSWRGKLQQNASEDRQKQVDAIANYLISMSHGLGDGLVTVESTRLEGVAHRTVDGTHLSMIRNITPSSRRIPSAVPIIIDRLKQ